MSLKKVSLLLTTLLLLLVMSCNLGDDKNDTPSNGTEEENKDDEPKEFEGPVTGFKVVEGSITGNSVKLTWDKIEDKTVKVWIFDKEFEEGKTIYPKKKTTNSVNEVTMDNLSSGREYTFYAYVVKVVDFENVYSEAASVTATTVDVDLIKLDTPVLTTRIGIDGDNQINVLEWNEVPNASKYYLYQDGEYIKTIQYVEFYNIPLGTPKAKYQVEAYPLGSQTYSKSDKSNTIEI